MICQRWRDGSGLVGASEPHRSGRPGGERGRKVAQQIRLGTGSREGEADPACGLSDASPELEQPEADRGELGSGEAVGGRDGVAHGEHQPVGGGVQDEPHLVGGGVPAGCAVGGKLGLVQLDQVLCLPAGAVQVGVEPGGRAGGDVRDDIADVEAQPRCLDASGDTTLLAPGLGRVRGLGT